MKQLTFTFLFCLAFHTLVGKQVRTDCENIYLSAVNLFKNDKYDLAIKKVAAYKLCNPNNSKKADGLLLQIFEKVNRQKDEALSSKKEALIQKDLANRRAELIAKQRDSIENENVANKIATQALQINEIDPNTAIQYIYSGFCFSPYNSALIEIRRKLINEEAIYEKLKLSNPYLTLSIKAKDSERFITSDGEGVIMLWETNTKKMIQSYKLFNSSIFCI